METRVFLSYARGDDEPFVQRLYEGLRSAGFEVWFDRASMPARQLAFQQEIRDAIVANDRLLLVVGPEAAKSDYVNQEWRFAYFEAVKLVNPIVRLDGKDAAGQAIDGYSLIPEDLRLIHAEDFRRDQEFELHLGNLVRQLSDPPPPVGKLVAVPELPSHYLAQRDRLSQLRDILLADLRKPVVVTGAAGRVGIHGMGGIGKSVLACALAHHPEIQRAFPDGVYWVTLGQEPRLDERQRWLAHELGGKDDFLGVDAGKEILRTLLRDRAALLLLDDVWRRDDAEAFNVVGPRGRLLLTTRDAGLVTALAAKENHFQVQLPTGSEARLLLAKAAGMAAEQLPSEAADVILECGRLPLALALCGGMVRGAESSPGVAWSDLLEALREHDLEFLSSSHPAEDQHASIWKAIHVSLRGLPEEQRTRFAELAVFGLDTGAPEAAVVTLWEHTAGLRPRETRRLLAKFGARSLVMQSEAGRVILHDLLHNFAAGMAPKQFGSLKALHQRLLEAYEKKCVNGLPSGPSDGYFQENLVRHLIAANRTEEAVSLLTELLWIEVKCKNGLAFGLQEDYRQTIAALPEAQAELRQDSIRRAQSARWTQTLIDCAREKRLPRQDEIIPSVQPWTDEQIAAESKRIIENPTRLDRLKAFSGFVEQEAYPLLEFGDRPGFVVQHAFNLAPGGTVHSAALTRLAAVTPPTILRIWPQGAAYNPMPALVRMLEGHTDDVQSVSVTADGLLAVSGSRDTTLRVWDLETGRCLHTLEGTHRVDFLGDAGVRVSITPEGKRAVSGSIDTTLRMWDLETGQCLRTIEGHTQWVNCVSVTPDGRGAVSGSGDHTLRVWDLETGKCLHVFEGPREYLLNWSMSSTEGLLRTIDEKKHSFESVSVTLDGRRAVAGIFGKTTLEVRDLETGQCLRTLAGHTNPVDCVSVTPDGTRAVSGSWDETLRVWEPETGQCLRTLEGHTGPVRSVSLTPDGRRAVSGSEDKTLRVWDLETGQCLRTLEGHTGAVQSVSLTPDGRRAVSGSKDKTLRVWDLETGQGMPTYKGHTNSVRSVTMAPDERRAVSGSEDCTLRVWDVQTGECLHTLGGHTGWVCSVRVTPNGQWGVSASWDKTVRVWNLRTGECLRTLEGHTDWVQSVSLTPDGRRVVSGGWDKTVRVWNLKTGTCVRTLSFKQVHHFLSVMDGRRVTSGSKYGSIWVWDLKTGECLRILRGDTEGIQTLSVTPDGRRAVLSASEDNTLYVWDLETDGIRTLAGMPSALLSVKVTPDGRWAMSGSEDKTLRVWDLETGECLALVRMNAPCLAVDARSPNRIVAGTSGGEVLFYKIHAFATNPPIPAPTAPHKPASDPPKRAFIHALKKILKLGRS